jgi:hypothetical protein
MVKSNKASLSSIEKTREGFKFNFGKTFLQILIGIVLLFLGVYHWLFGLIFIVYIFAIVFINIKSHLNYFKTIISKGKETNKIIVENKKPFREVEVKLKK